MKKILTLLLLAISAFTFKATAQVTTCNAEFTWQLTNGNTVKFTPAVNDSPMVHHEWHFGDGSANSQAVSPTHSYLTNGSFVVMHTVVRYSANNTVICTQTITHTIIIQQAPPPCTLAVDFSWTVTQTNSLRIEFHNLSTPLAATDSITWIFGDGTTVKGLESDPTVNNPLHTYANAGNYNVCLIVKKNNNTTPSCIKYTCKPVVVSAPCNLVVDFSWTVTQTNPLRIEFHNLSTPLATNDSIRWTFGDGSSSTDVNPVHTYNVAGTYTVCLWVKKVTPAGSTSCVREICKTIVVTIPCNLVVDFNWTATATNPLSIEFHNLTTPIAATDSIRWTFGDGSSSSAVNPLHIYNTPGTYTVCLRVIRYNAGSTVPCIREICKTIVVQELCNLIVNFTSQADSLHPLRIKFTNTSVPINVTDSVHWTFGDGISLSGLQSDPSVANPTHDYANAGTYNVCLIVKKNNNSANTCIRYSCKSIVVQEPCNLVVNFTSQADSLHPLQIKFTNTSTPLNVTDSVHWTFGDGTSLSGLQGDPNVANPTHNYANAGTFTVCLIVKKNNNSPNTCIRYSCKSIVIHEPCTLVVNFTSQPDSLHPLRIKFTNTSTPLNITDSVRWTFGDGTSVSGLQGDPNVANPTHNYANAGTYTVCLRVKKNNSSNTALCVGEKCSTVLVTIPCNFYVNFSWHLDSLNPRKVYFTNLSTPPTTSAIAVWTFGDGTSITSWNAVHEYAQPGTYRVCLRVYLGANSNCVREICDSVTIHNPPPACLELSKFHFEKFPTDNQKYKFTPDYINTTLQYTWTFGDGTGSHDVIATHRYTHAGTYTACLTVWRGPDCASTTCHDIRVEAQVNCDTAHVSYTYQRNTQVPNRVQFYANGSLPVIDQTWTFTKVPGGSTVTLHQNDPIYLFQDTGYFKVCLRAVLLGGCVKEYCNYIRIEHVSNACELQAFPNPANEAVNVNVYLTQAETIHAYVYNSLNVLVLDKVQQGFTGNNLVTLNINSLVAGQYIIRFVYGNHVCYARFQKL